jgi:hypothetical protein
LRRLGIVLAPPLLCVSQARGEPAPLTLRCEIGDPACDALAADLAERIGREGRRLVRTGDAEPRARVTARGGGVHVTVVARGRAPVESDVPPDGGVVEPWRIALTVEQLLGRAEAPDAARDGPVAGPAPGPSPGTLFFGLAGGTRGDLIEESLRPALQGGLVAGWQPTGPIVARVRAYGELLFAGPWATEAFGVAAGPGLLIFERPSLRVDVVLEGFARIMRARYRSGDPLCAGEDFGNDLEAGVGLWADLFAFDWALRPFATAGVEAFARRNPSVVCDALDPPLVAPSVHVGLVYAP